MAPQRYAQKNAQNDRRGADDHGTTRTVDDPRPDVAAIRIGTEPVVPADRGQRGIRHVEGIVPVQDVSEDGNHDHHQYDECAAGRQFALPQFAGHVAQVSHHVAHPSTKCWRLDPDVFQIQ